MESHFSSEIKRHWPDTEDSEVLQKKHRRDNNEQETTSCMENFCADIFLEIFDYLEGGELYMAFQDLNARFERLLDVSNLRIWTYSHCELLKSSQAYYKALIAPNKQRIFALSVHFTWSNRLLLSDPFLDASFIRLQSLRLHYVRETSIIPLLIVLADIPLLTDLYLRVGDDWKDFTDIYQRIFALPSIRFLEVVTYALVKPISLPVSTADRFTRIESLTVDHQCTDNELLTLLSYTPRLCRLTCESIIGPSVSMARESFTAIPSLTRIAIADWEAGFLGFETLLTKIAPALQTLSIFYFRTADFLNGERWERILSQHLPDLSKLTFKYTERLNDQFTVTRHHERIHRFSSPFWVNKQWLFNILIDIDDNSKSIVSYTIEPAEKQNSTVVDQEMLTSFPTILSEGNRLSLCEIPVFDVDESYIELLGPMLLSSHVTCLDIDISGIFAGPLISLIQHLPNLHSLVVKSIEPPEGERLSVEEADALQLVSQRRSITKVRLINLHSLDEIQFLINLCPGMQYLEIDDTNDIDLELLVRFILLTVNQSLPNLFFICLGARKSNGTWLERLDRMIGSEQLRRDYTIQEIQAKIYLRWTVQ